MWAKIDFDENKAKDDRDEEMKKRKKGVSSPPFSELTHLLLEIYMAAVASGSLRTRTLRTAAASVITALAGIAAVATATTVTTIAVIGVVLVRRSHMLHHLTVSVVASNIDASLGELLPDFGVWHEDDVAAVDERRAHLVHILHGGRVQTESE